MKLALPRIFSAVIAAAVTLSPFVAAGPAVTETFAAANIGRVTVDGNKTDYDNLSKLAEKVAELKGKTFTIEMYSDWGNEELAIPEDATVTLNMNGYMFNRGLTEYKKRGDVIVVGSGTTLTINGGAKDRITDEISMKFVSMETKKEPHARLWHEVQ